MSKLNTIRNIYAKFQVNQMKIMIYGNTNWIPKSGRPRCSAAWKISLLTATGDLSEWRVSIHKENE